MKTKKMVLVAVAQAVGVFILNTQVLAEVICTVSYSDGLSCGVCTCPLSATTTQAATLTTPSCLCQDGGSCYKAVIDEAYAFSYACSILLPEVGKTYEKGLFDQTFHDTTKTHEDWHYKYMVALVGATYGALETWSASYESNCTHTEAAALALGNADLANALTVAQNAFTNDVYTQVTYETQANSYCHVVDVNGTDTWRSVNPDWGQVAVDYASSITVSFTKGAGDCVCIPEPSCIVALISMGAVGLLIARRKALLAGKQ